MLWHCAAAALADPRGTTGVTSSRDSERRSIVVAIIIVKTAILLLLPGTQVWLSARVELAQGRASPHGGAIASVAVYIYFPWGDEDQIAPCQVRFTV